jgi:hypothetical protein
MDVALEKKKNGAALTTVSTKDNNDEKNRYIFYQISEKKDNFSNLNDTLMKYINAIEVDETVKMTYNFKIDKLVDEINDVNESDEVILEHIKVCLYAYVYGYNCIYIHMYVYFYVNI